MQINFGTDDWDLIRVKLSGAVLDKEYRDFLKKTFDLWQKGRFGLVLNTSGSTGKPKTIRLDSKILEWSILTSSTALGLGEKEHVMCCLPVNKTGGAMQVARAYYKKWALSILPPSADPLAGIDADHNFTITSLTPFQLNHIMENEHSVRVLMKFRTVLIGGGAISPELREKLLHIGGTTSFIQTYGMTETASHVALADLREDGWFTPLEGVSIEPGNHGNAVIRIDALHMKLETTDRVEWKNNQFRVLGRSDFVINSGGLKLHPEDLESGIRAEMDGMDMDFFLYGLPDAALGQRLVMLVEGEYDSGFEAQIQEILQGAERPRAFYYLPAFIYTATGKLDRHGTADLIRDIS